MRLIRNRAGASGKCGDRNGVFSGDGKMGIQRYALCIAACGAALGLAACGGSDGSGGPSFGQLSDEAMALLDKFDNEDPDVTTLDQMPAAGTANYQGNTYAMIDINDDIDELADGEMLSRLRLGVDFATGNVEGSIYDIAIYGGGDVSGSLPVDGSIVAGNEINATANGDVMVYGQTFTATLGLPGNFYGADAEYIRGTAAGDLAVGSTQIGTISGIYGAEKQ